MSFTGGQIPPFTFKSVSAFGESIERSVIKSEPEGLERLENSSYESNSDGALEFSLVRVGDASIVWKFICAPTSVKWAKTGETSTVAAYGTNQPVLVYSSTSLRQLSLTDVIVEGFIYKKQILDLIKDLENMMNMVADADEGFTSPYIWSLKAGASSYGLYIITALDVEETLRDAKGRATRATIGIQFQEVGNFQIDNGRDLAVRGELANPNQEALDALNPDDTDGTGGGDGKAPGDKTGDGTTVTESDISEGVSGIIVEKGETQAICALSKDGKTCKSVDPEDNERFEKLGYPNGSTLKEGITVVYK